MFRYRAYCNRKASSDGWLSETGHIRLHTYRYSVRGIKQTTKRSMGKNRDKWRMMMHAVVLALLTCLSLCSLWAWACFGFVRFCCLSGAELSACVMSVFISTCLHWAIEGLSCCRLSSCLRLVVVLPAVAFGSGCMCADLLHAH